MLKQTNFAKGVFRAWIVFYLLWIGYGVVNKESEIIIVYRYIFSYEEANREYVSSKSLSFDYCIDGLYAKSEKYMFYNIEMDTIDHYKNSCKYITILEDYSELEKVLAQDAIECMENSKCSNLYKEELVNRIKTVQETIINNESSLSINQEPIELLKHFFAVPFGILFVTYLLLFFLKISYYILKWVVNGFRSKNT